MLYDWQEERELDLASEEVASAIREAQMMVKSGHEDITMAAMSVTFYCDEEAGRVSYLTKRGVKFIQPRGDAVCQYPCRGKALCRLPQGWLRGLGRKWEVYHAAPDEGWKA